MVTLKVVGVVLVGISLLAQGLWWRQVRRAGGDTSVIVPVFTICIAMLIGVLPSLLWPTREPIQIAGSLVSILLTTVVMVVSIRRLSHWRRRAVPK